MNNIPSWSYVIGGIGIAATAGVLIYFGVALYELHSVMKVINGK
jgi:hypothetical protein